MLDGRATILIKTILAGCVLGGCLVFLPHAVQAATGDSATLQWAANVEPDLAGYRVYHGTTPGIYGIPQTIGKTTTYHYANLQSNKTHYFTLTAYDTSGNESLPSPEVSKFIAEASTVAAPPPPTTTAQNSGLRRALTHNSWQTGPYRSSQPPLGVVEGRRVNT